MKILSLCTGYGGLDLAVEAVTGGRVITTADNDRNASRVITRRFAGIPNLGDIRHVRWQDWAGVDVITAGYPCQPFSRAGKLKGTDDARHIFPHIANAIRAVRPRYVVLENVSAHLILGFTEVQGAMATAGYDTRWVCVRASDIGACHKRERVFIVAANTTDYGYKRHRETWARGVRPENHYRATTHGYSPGFPQFGGLEPNERDTDRRDSENTVRDSSESQTWGIYAPAIERWAGIVGREAPTATTVGRKLNPIFVEWMMGLSAGWVTDVHIPRGAKLKILGNGVVPQQAAYALTLLGLGEESWG